MTHPSFEVVTVPDFSGAAAAVFEARALVFLSAWLEYAGEARALPLHLACIGEPPRSVQALAERARARVTVHAPVRAEQLRGSNKLRGLEVADGSAPLLLLDTDVFCLRDPSGAAGLGDAPAVLPAFWPRVPERLWHRIYAAAGLPLPEQRLPCTRSALGCAPLRVTLCPEQNAEAPAMLPYFNGGVLWLPQTGDLRPRWEAAIRQAIEAVGGEAAQWPSIIASDQAGLAVALAQWQRAGQPVRLLPHAFNTCLLHLYRWPDWNQRILFHAYHVFQNMKRLNVKGGLWSYQLYLTRRVLAEWKDEMLYRPDAGTLPRYAVRGIWRAARLGAALRSAYRRHAAP